MRPMRRVDLLRGDVTYWQPIDWECRECTFVLQAPNAAAGRLPATAHYIATGHVRYEPKGSSPPTTH